jgi:hypothetical protein
MVFSFRPESRSPSTGFPTLKEIDYGGMLLTTQNIYGIGIFRDSASANAEVFTVLERNPEGGNPVSARPVFGWFSV